VTQTDDLDEQSADTLVPATEDKSVEGAESEEATMRTIERRATSTDYEPQQ
jgi:hypothetical protein